MTYTVADLLARVRSVDPEQTEFHQAVEEVLESVVPVVNEHPAYRRDGVLERLLEPDRVLRFRVTWEDDEGGVHVHRGWRVQHCNVLGPYKGGLRLHPSVNAGVLKFLAFEQTFKNSLTGLPLGAGKGGSDFDPKGRSDREIMRFCQAFMNQLWRQIGPETDVPAGDIGVGRREVDYLFGHYKRLARSWGGSMTGKAALLGGIALRTEATGYGAVMFARAMLRHADRGSFEGKRAAISGAGNVALYAAEKLIAEGATVVTLSDSRGLLRFPEGLQKADLDKINVAKTEHRRTLEDIAQDVDAAEYEAGAKPWGEACDVAFPCATQNEIDGDEAKTLIDSGCILVAEGANMPSNHEAVAMFRESDMLFAPGKAANAGGVAVSGLEMAQNAAKRVWKRDVVELELEGIMSHIHDQCAQEGERENGRPVDYVKGANIAGFRRVADALVSSGIG